MSLKDITNQRMQALGIVPKRSLGQNFLISESVVSKIIAAVESRPGPLVEIGPGLGALTDRLRALSRDYRAIELDQKFAEFWRSQGVQVLEQDALKVEWKEIFGEGGVLVSNLPYQISARLVVDLSFEPFKPQSMILMFQKEVAERCMAQPRSADYGLLSVVSQLFWKLDRVTSAGTHDFFPAPNVTSRVLSFDKRNDGPVHEKGLLNFVKQAFGMRRKFLTNNLEPLYSRQRVVLALERLGHSAKARAEELGPNQILELYRCLSEDKPADGSQK